MPKPADKSLDLPVAQTAAPSREDALTISLTAEGAVALDHEPFTLAALPEALRSRQAAHRIEVVLINADREVPHGTVMAVLDAVRQAGIERVSFQTSPEAGHDR